MSAQWWWGGGEPVFPLDPLERFSLRPPELAPVTGWSRLRQIDCDISQREPSLSLEAAKARPGRACAPLKPPVIGPWWCHAVSPRSAISSADFSAVYTEHSSGVAAVYHGSKSYFSTSVLFTNSKHLWFQPSGKADPQRVPLRWVLLLNSILRNLLLLKTDCQWTTAYKCMPNVERLTFNIFLLKLCIQCVNLFTLYFTINSTLI